MWSGGRPAKKWKSLEAPQMLPQGTGVDFINAESRLRVQIIGSISIEEFESGKEEIEGGFYQESAYDRPREDAPGESNIERLF
jgi:hypothetical protein